jgi:hypothetical protein
MFFALGGIPRVLGVDEGADASAPLRLRDHVVDEGRLARGLGAEDLDDPAARLPTTRQLDTKLDTRPSRAEGSVREGLK